MGFAKIRLLTAGESHGQVVTAILEGLPAHLRISREKLQQQMKRRQLGYGRSARMDTETDEVEITAGLRFGSTTGAPLGFLVRNLDAPNWLEEMSVWDRPATLKKVVHNPRPGHADLAGGLKYGEHDLRNILERASARETVARTAAGAICRQLLEQVDIEICSHVLSIGNIKTSMANPDWNSIAAVQASDRLRCVDPHAERTMIEMIDVAKKEKETLGGTFEVVARNVPPGLGAHTHWDQKIDGRIAQAILSIPAVKGVAIGNAFDLAQESGSRAHDEIFYAADRGFYRKTNRAGGTEGGITNGEEIRVVAAMKPLATLMKPLQSVDVISKES
ncbi:MAG TPA: chorismate synthase, partial [Acidobacteriota bacterium]